VDPPSDPAAGPPGGPSPGAIVIEEDETVRLALTRLLRRAGFIVHTATDPPHTVAGPHSQFLRPVLVIENLRCRWMLQQEALEKWQEAVDKPT
jgi:CheY-like chemotaxis protein